MSSHHFYSTPKILPSFPPLISSLDKRFLSQQLMLFTFPTSGTHFSSFFFAAGGFLPPDSSHHQSGIFHEGTHVGDLGIPVHPLLYSRTPELLTNSGPNPISERSPEA